MGRMAAQLFQPVAKVVRIELRIEARLEIALHSGALGSEAE